MSEKLETTYYRFLSEVRAFLAKLKNNPINAEPSKYLKDRNFNKTKLINVLMKKGILERDEKILTPDKTGEKKVKYSVKYNIRKKDFETKIHRIYIRYFEKNEPEKVELNEMNANHFPELSKVEKEKNGFAGMKGDAVYTFGKNGLGLTDELIKLGKEIKKLSKDNNVYLRDSSIDACDDVYTLSFDVSPIAKDDKEYQNTDKDDVNEAIRECGITMGVIGGGRKGETAERWAKYINDNENSFKRSVFKDEESMKKAMMKNPQDKEIYQKRGGIKECEGGEGGVSIEGASSSAISNTNAPIVPLFGVQRREIMKGRNKDEKPENILGKTINAESKKSRKIYITEEQYNIILKEEGLGDAGDIGDYTANGLVLKTRDGKEDPCVKAGKIKVKMIMDK